MEVIYPRWVANSSSRLWVEIRRIEYEDQNCRRATVTVLSIKRLVESRVP
jgi:hypothetical protein